MRARKFLTVVISYPLSVLICAVCAVFFANLLGDILVLEDGAYNFVVGVFFVLFAYFSFRYYVPELNGIWLGSPVSRKKPWITSFLDMSASSAFCTAIVMQLLQGKMSLSEEFYYFVVGGIFVVFFILMLFLFVKGRDKW